MSNLQKLKDDAARSIGGRTKAEAHEQAVCVFCQGAVTGFRDALSSKEYGISGMCQSCQDDFFTEED